MQVEDVAGVGLASGRAMQRKRHLAICHRLLGEVVVHHQRMPAGVAEVLANGRPGKGSVILERSRVRCRSSYHHGVVHGPVLPQRFYDGSHGGALLTHGYVNAEHRLPGFIYGHKNKMCLS